MPAAAFWADVVGFALVVLLTEAMRRLALRRRLTDRPGAGKIHTRPTPYLGGVAIAVGTLATIAAVAHPLDRRVLALAAAAACVGALGLIDDLRQLSPANRLVIEVLGATAVVAAGVRADVLGRGLMLGHWLLLGHGAGAWLDGAGTVLWIVVITNSFNLLDNMDGALAGVSLVTAGALGLLALSARQQDLAILLIALSAGCAGFLVHNWTPARIFMGDAGSLFLGFVISASTVLICAAPAAAGAGRALTAAGAMLLMTFVAVTDTCTVLVSRRRAGLPWRQGGADHLAHRLRALGLSTTGTALALAAAAAASCTLGVLVLRGALPAAGSLAVTIAAGVALVILAQLAGGSMTGRAPAPRTQRAAGSPRYPDGRARFNR